MSNTTAPNQTPSTMTTIKPYFDVDETDHMPPIDAIDLDDELDDEEAQVDDNNNPEDNPNTEFDEKDEFLNEPAPSAPPAAAPPQPKKSIDTIITPQPPSDFRLAQRNQFTRSPINYSMHPEVEHRQLATFEFLDKSDYDERHIDQISNVFCMCDANRGLRKETGSRRNLLPGRLVLTNYRLQFLPDDCDMNEYFAVDPSLLLFSTSSCKWAVCIPLTFVYDIRASKAIELFIFYFFINVKSCFIF